MMDLAVQGRLFEDIIDGYFALGESLHQALDRNGFGAALVVISHAPVLHLPGQGAGVPVPMRLVDDGAGLIRRFIGIAVIQGTGLRLVGAGDWAWYDDQPERPLSEATRLAEPAFIRGIGLNRGGIPSRDFGRVAPSPRAAEAIRLVQSHDDGGPAEARHRGRLWGFRVALDGIVPCAALDAGTICTGADAAAGPAPVGPCLLIDPRDPRLSALASAMAGDFNT